MDILIPVIFLAGVLTAVVYGIEGNGIGAVLLTVILACVAFYFWLTREIETSNNAYGLVAWPVMLIIYLLIVIATGASGIWIVKKVTDDGN